MTGLSNERSDDIALFLGHASAPPPAPADLTDSILAAATAMLQDSVTTAAAYPRRAQRSPLHRGMWVGVVGISLVSAVAAAAAATAWDGQRFDVTRLAAAPAKVLHVLTGHHKAAGRPAAAPVVTEAPPAPVLVPPAPPETPATDSSAAVILPPAVTERLGSKEAVRHTRALARASRPHLGEVKDRLEAAPVEQPPDRVIAEPPRPTEVPQPPERLEAAKPAEVREAQALSRAERQALMAERRARQAERQERLAARADALAKAQTAQAAQAAKAAEPASKAKDGAKPKTDAEGKKDGDQGLSGARKVPGRRGAGRGARGLGPGRGEGRLGARAQ